MALWCSLFVPIRHFRAWINVKPWCFCVLCTYLQIPHTFSAHPVVPELPNSPNFVLLFSLHFLKYQVKEMLQPFLLLEKSETDSGGRQLNN